MLCLFILFFQSGVASVRIVFAKQADCVAVLAGIRAAILSAQISS